MKILSALNTLVLVAILVALLAIRAQMQKPLRVQEPVEISGSNWQYASPVPVKILRER